MCWYSAEHGGYTLVNAEAGERLVIRQMHGYARWAVRERDLTETRPAAVCLLTGTRVVFRPAAGHNGAGLVEGETEAVFRMLSCPRRDVFELPDGTQVELNSLPTGLVFDVLVVPGKEPLSAILAGNRHGHDEAAVEREHDSMLARVMRMF